MPLQVCAFFMGRAAGTLGIVRCVALLCGSKFGQQNSKY